MVLNSKLPLKIILCWAKGFTDGHEIADRLENIYGFHKDAKQAFLDIHLDKLEYQTPEQATEILEDNLAENTLIVFLATAFTEMMKSCFETLIRFKKQYTEDDIKILPIAYNSEIFEVNGLKNLESVRIYEYTDERKQLLRLEQAISHALCKFYLKKNKKVKLFLSHAKKDYGKEIAEKLQTYLSVKSKLHSFFDVHDIEEGEEFESEILNSLKECTLLVIQSDIYSSRHWCIKEVLEAKREYRPILRWICLDQGELRSNPYFGNTPTVVSKIMRTDEDTFDLIINKALRETLRYFYFEKYVKFKLAGEFDFDNQNDICIIPFHPEVIGINFLVKNKLETKYIIYPAPVLALSEQELLAELFPDLIFASIENHF